MRRTTSLLIAIANARARCSDPATKLFIRARESVVRSRDGQTMTEYALILAAIAVVAWGAYNLMGQNIGTMASGIDSALTNS
jgi:Flp pilus assembly pilin Flp